MNLAGSVSTKVDLAAVSSMSVARSDKMLTQQELDECWAKVMSSTDEARQPMVELLKNHKPVMGEDNTFSLQFPNSFLEAEFKKHKVSLLLALRTLSGSRSLNVKSEVVRVETETKAYRPDEKFNAMQARNPMLANLRDLFPTIDY